MTSSASTPNLSAHLAEDLLQTVALGELVLSTAERAHLDQCVSCRQRWAAIELLQEELAVARLSAPSATAHERYLALFREADVNATDPLTTFAGYLGHLADAVVAAVMWNGRERLALQGVRNMATTSYRMLYSTEQAEIELLIEPAAGNFSIEGEVLPLGKEVLFPVLVEVHERHTNTAYYTPRFSTESDDDGRFHIPPMPAGAYALYLAPTSGTALMIDPLELA
ncbi:MAG TPA: hypothetical protein P5121_20190 [Caldilineaceae bacterium]|nr:hypothetical protein [Caldilineaceae bacterium]